MILSMCETNDTIDIQILRFNEERHPLWEYYSKWSLLFET